MQQYDLTGQLVEDTSAAVPVEVEPSRPAVQLDLGLRQLVPTVTRSVRWRGQVSQSTLDMELASSDSTEDDPPADWLTDDEYSLAHGPDGRGPLDWSSWPESRRLEILARVEAGQDLDDAIAETEV